MHSSRFVGIAVLLGGLLILGWASAEEVDDTVDAAPPESPPPFHENPKQVLADFQDAAAAAILDDMEGQTAALNRIRADCLPIHDPVDERFPAVLRSHSRAFVSVIETTNAHAAEAMAVGDVHPIIIDKMHDRTFEQYQWVERGCRLCHAEARRLGLLASPD